MKKIFLLATIICFATYSFAQSDKYVAAMKTNISMMDSMMAKNNPAEVSNNFERIADAEKTQWLPYYYAAYCKAMQGYMEQDVSKKDAIADKAQDLIGKAETNLGKENSETDVVKAIIATIHMTVDPQSRYMTYGAAISKNLDESKALDPTNPRPILVLAENTYYTPKQFGGGPEVAKPMLDEAKKLDEAFKPETELSPNWGKGSIEYFLSLYK
ncbi:MAG: hypothetical protein ABI594_03145 [Ginsengibacter sp.]